jgi:creatinine amidohydrolase/Fe(II)-dependent formamide hydrolase-like protein
MALRPQLVRSLDLAPQPIEFAALRRARSFRELGSGEGYTGDPAASSADLGARLLKRYSDRFGDLVMRHLAGEDVRPELSIRGLF